MSTKRTELVFILDKSGSMYPLADDTVGGFNAVLADQKKLEGDCRVTTILFDSDVSLLHDRTDLPAVQAMRSEDFRPFGCTALYDAIGYGIDKITRVQQSMLPEYRAEKVLIVIMTDGMENASHHETWKSVQEKIKKAQEAQGFEFLFLGANVDAPAVAASMGIAPECAATYIADEDGTELNFEAVSRAASSIREMGMMQPTEILSGVREYTASVQDEPEKKGRRFRKNKK